MTQVATHHHVSRTSSHQQLSASAAANVSETPNTAHSTNPVPVVVLADKVKGLHNGILADVAPTILDLMDVKKPVEMTGSSLLIR